MEWKVIKPDVFAAIMDFFTSGLPVVSEGSHQSKDTGKHFHANVLIREIRIGEMFLLMKINIFSFFSTFR